MGLGDFPIAFGPLGFDPPASVAASPRYLPIAPYYDPASRQFPLVEGQVAAIHPVDQRVAILLGTKLASIKHMADSGLDVDRIRRAQPAKLQAVIDDEVARVLSALVDAKDVSIVSSQLDPDAHGRPIFIVNYINLRLPKGAPITSVKVNTVNG